MLASILKISGREDEGRGRERRGRGRERRRRGGRGEGGVESGRRGRIRRVLSMQSHRSDPATVWRQNEIRRRKESMVVVNHNWNNSRVNVCTITMVTMVTADRMLVTLTVLATPGSYYFSWSLFSKKGSLQVRYVSILQNFLCEYSTNGLMATTHSVLSHSLWLHRIGRVSFSEHQHRPCDPQN